MGFDDKDFEMEDIQGEVTDENEVIVVLEPPQEPNNEETEWDKCVARLEKHCEKTWVCVPYRHLAHSERRQWVIADIETCSGELFFIWLCHIFPVAKTLKHKPADYDILDHRHKAFYNVINQLKMLEFPKTPEMHAPKAKKKE